MKKVDKTTAKVIKKITKIAKEYGVATDSLDLSALIDNTLTVDENMSKILQKMAMLIPDEEKRIEFMEKYIKPAKADEEKMTEAMAEEQRKRIEQMREEQAKIMGGLMHMVGYDKFCEEYYGWRIDLAMNSNYNHLIIINGVGGIGKTSFVDNYLNAKYGDYKKIVIKGEVTAPALWETIRSLEGYEKAVLIWDNAPHSAFKDYKIRNLLEQATDKTPNGKRTVKYLNAKTIKENSTEVTLETTHKIIITTNYWTESAETQPIKDRAVVINMDGYIASKYAWKLLAMKTTKEQYQFVLETLSKIYGTQDTDRIPLTFRDVLEIKEAINMLWSEKDRDNKFVLMFLDKNKLLYKAYNIYRSHSKPYSKNAIRDWTEITGKSRTYYINMIKTLKELGVIGGEDRIDELGEETKNNILKNINRKFGQKMVKQ